jgi:hypothetical protein
VNGIANREGLFGRIVLERWNRVAYWLSHPIAPATLGEGGTTWQDVGSQSTTKKKI